MRMCFSARSRPMHWEPEVSNRATVCCLRAKCAPTKPDFDELAHAHSQGDLLKKCIMMDSLPLQKASAHETLWNDLFEAKAL